MRRLRAPHFFAPSCPRPGQVNRRFDIALPVGRASSRKPEGAKRNEHNPVLLWG